MKVINRDFTALRFERERYLIVLRRSLIEEREYARVRNAPFTAADVLESAEELDAENPNELQTSYAFELDLNDADALVLADAVDDVSARVLSSTELLSRHQLSLNFAIEYVREVELNFGVSLLKRAGR